MANLFFIYHFNILTMNTFFNSIPYINAVLKLPSKQMFFKILTPSKITTLYVTNITITSVLFILTEINKI